MTTVVEGNAQDPMTRPIAVCLQKAKNCIDVTTFRLPCKWNVDRGFSLFWLFFKGKSPVGNFHVTQVTSKVIDLVNHPLHTTFGRAVIVVLPTKIIWHPPWKSSACSSRHRRTDCRLNEWPTRVLRTRNPTRHVLEIAMHWTYIPPLFYSILLS